MIKSSAAIPIPLEISPFRLEELHDHVRLALPTEDIPGMLKRLSIQVSSSDTLCFDKLDADKSSKVNGCDIHKSLNSNATLSFSI